MKKIFAVGIRRQVEKSRQIRCEFVNVLTGSTFHRQKEKFVKLMKTVWVLLFGTLAFGLAAAAVAQELNDPSVPGSVLVFPKFVRGNVGVDASGRTIPKTEIEISVTCPPGQSCVEGTRVKLLAHWVCPGSQKSHDKYICRETDFVLFTTVFGTLTFNPDNNPPLEGQWPGVTPPQGGVRVPACEKGYLVVWVVDLSDNPIKYDGLIGDAVVRYADGAAHAYNAYPIQAIEGLGHGAKTDVDFHGDLDFDGLTEYKAATGAIIGTVRYNEPATTPAPSASVVTSLTLLTLDVRSNRPNAPTFVDLVFFNAFEVPTSTFWEFICWTQVNLEKIDENLTRGLQGSRKGLVVSGPAEKWNFNGVDDPQEGYVTLIGIVETRERRAAGGEASYSYSLYNDGNYVPTYFKYDWRYPEDEEVD